VSSIRSTAIAIAVTSIVMGGYLVATRHIADITMRQDELHNRMMRLTEMVQRRAGNSAQVRDAPADAATAAVPALRLELAELREQQSDLRRTLDGMLLNSSAGNVGDIPDAFGTDVESEVPTVTPEPATEVDDHFQSEIVDTGWDVMAEAAIQSAFANRSPTGVTITSTDCRGTVCRVEVEFGNTRFRLEEVPFLPMLMPWAGQSYVHSDAASGTNTATLYMAREGYSLRGEPLELEETGAGY
jgi:hypothetical protein